MTEITTDEGETNVLENIRWDRRLMHWHPYIDLGNRRRNIRGNIKRSLARVRPYRAEKAARSARKVVAA